MSATEQRDRGLRQVSSLTRWLAAGGLAAVGVFAAIAAHAAPGKAKTTTVRSGSGDDGIEQPAPPAPSDPSLSGGGRLTPPQQPLRRGRGGGSVTSGGS